MNSKVMKGCGIGCGVVAVLFLALVGGGAWFARQMGKEYKTVEQTEKALFAAQGGLEDWTPPPGLVPPEGRLEIFVAARDSTAEWRAKLAADIARFQAEHEQGKGLGKVWRSIRAGSDLGLSYARYWNARNRALTSLGMGPGEYVWYYGLVYYADLGHDPGAGAGNFDIRRSRGLEVTVAAGERDPVGEARRRMHDLLTPFVQRAAPDSAGVTTAELEAERARLASDPQRVPWQDGLPAPLAEAVAPWRDPLAAAWNERVNPLELMFDLKSWAEEQQKKEKAAGD